MAYRGHIENGMAIFDEPVELPDGTPVRVEVEPTRGEFWRDRTVEQLASEQGVAPCDDPAQLAGAWPADEPVDEFLAFLREVRR